MKLYARQAQVTVAGLRADSLSADRTTNAVVISRLRIRFDVKKNLGKEPNKCVIKINGLSETTRSQLEVLPLRVILHAGYDGVLKLLFDGDMKRAFSDREGSCDVVTELHVGDGHRAYASANLTKSYKGTTLRQIVTDCANSMSLPVPPDVRSSAAFAQTIQEFSSDGPTREALTAALSRFGYSWSTQNRQLVILKDSQVRESQEILVNQATGLVNSPKYKGSEKAGAKTEITFDSLLYPEIVPGVKVRLESQLIRKSMKVTDATSKGDTHSSGPDWITSVTGVPL